MTVMRRLQLGLLLLATLSLGIVGGSCVEPAWEIEMITRCSPLAFLSTCSEICKESGGFQCTESDDCPAPAFGLDVGECELPLEGEGMPLDVGCDDPLPEDEYFGFSCCCRSRVTKY